VDSGSIACHRLNFRDGPSALLCIGLDTAKVQSYELLQVAAPIFGLAGIGSSLSGIYTAVRTELFQSFDEVIKAAALNCFTAVVRVVASSAVDNDLPEGGNGAPTATEAETDSEPLITFLTPLLTESVRHLTDFDTGLIRLHGKLVEAAARGGSKACRHVCGHMFPAILEHAAKSTTKDHSHAYTDVVTALLDAVLGGGGGLAASDQFVLEPAWKVGMMTMFEEGGSSDSGSLRTKSLEGMAKLIQSKAVFGDELERTCRAVVGVLLADTEAAVRKAARTVIEAAAVERPVVVAAIVLPALKVGLRPSAEEGPRCMWADELATTMVKVAVDLPTALLVLAETMQLLDGAASGLDEGQVAAVSAAPRDVLIRLAERYPAEDLFDRAIKPCVHALLVPVAASQGGALPWSAATLTALAAGFQACCQVLPKEQQAVALQAVTALVRDGDFGAFGVSDNTFVLLKCANKPAARLGLVLPALAACFHRDVTSALDGLLDLIKLVVAAAMETTDYELGRALAITAAGLANKCADDGDHLLLPSYLEALSTAVKAGGGGEGGTTAARARHVQIWAWLCKALVMQAHPAGRTFTDELVRLLGDPEVGEAAAEAFAVVVGDCTDALSGSSHANLRLMYRQRFFHENVPLLIAGLHGADTGVKRNYLVALMHLLSAVSQQVLLSKISEVFPILVQSLSQSEEALIEPTLQMTISLVETAPEYIGKQLGALMPLLTTLSAHRKMGVRCQVLKCMTMLADLPAHVLYPLVAAVLKTVQARLDDSKRLVRREAVTCSSKWYLLGGGGNH
jgi:DNA repair/transcription protein MET18/MMS19